MANDPLNWLLLAEVLVVVIVASAFLFYWNRLGGRVLAWLIRLYAWRRHNAYISIGSLQVSPLAGRIAFRDIQYHSSNLSVRALHGHVTFRYWWARVRQEGDAQSGNPKRQKMPSRIMVNLEGVEMFVFNRTPAYDNIVERMKKHEREEAAAEGKKRGSDGSQSPIKENPITLRLRKVYKAATAGKGGDEERLESVDSNDSASSRSGGKVNDIPNIVRPADVPMPAEASAVDWFREMLPVDIRVQTGSIILGSDATPMLLIGSFKRAEGKLEITDSRSICDKYKMVVELRFEKPKVIYRTNKEYSGPLLAHGKKVYDKIVQEKPDVTEQPPSHMSARPAFQALAKILAFIRDPDFSIPPIKGVPTDRTWKGLARYQDHAPSDKPFVESKEYAKVSTLLDTPLLELTYFADTPGPVPDRSEIAQPDEQDEHGNVDLPPEYGIDINIYGGNVNYGPWADRQRDALQRAFAPSIFFNTEPLAKLRKGDTRVHSNLAVTVQICQETTLRIPTRDPSRDWRFAPEPDTKPSVSAKDKSDRPYAWLEVKVGANSSVIYSQAQYATNTGYDSMVVLHLDSLSISSSVNSLHFITARACKLSVTMPTPLEWNAQRNWGLDVTLENPKVALLRDHVTLISDLSRDWSNGAVGDYHHFVPMHYNFRVTLLNYDVRLYINDNNIIDNPLSLDENAFVVITGPRLSSYVSVDSSQYRPATSVIPFSVNLQQAKVAIILPNWDTHYTFTCTEDIGSGDAAGRALEIGKIADCSAEGSYRYYSSTHPDHQETLILHLDAEGVAFKCLGWVLRRLFCVKDNYFGMFTQFSQSIEFLHRHAADPKSIGDPVEEKYHPGRSDALTVNVTLDVRDSLILLSDEIYSCDSGLVMPVPQFQMSLKSVEAFMEMSLDAPPTYIVPAPDFAAVYETMHVPELSSTEAVSIEGLSIKANRLFGPQPRGATYLCLWEASVPGLRADVTPAFLISLKQSIKAVIYNFVDEENAPTKLYVPASDPDVTFFKLSLDRACVRMAANDLSAVVIDLPCGINLDTSSLATLTSVSSIGVVLPEIMVSILQRPSDTAKWSTAGSFRSGMGVDVYNNPEDSRRKTADQQRFIRKQDEETRRIWYMYGDRAGQDDDQGGLHAHNVYLPRPRMATSDVDERSLSDYSDGSSTLSEESSVLPDIRTIAQQTRRRRADRSFTTAKEALSDSEDSDATDSTHASVDSLSAFGGKGSQNNADLLVHNELEEPRADADTASVPLMGQGLAVATQKSNGRLIRLRFRPVVVRIKPAAVDVLSSLGAGIKATSPRPMQILDNLLDTQVDAILAGVVTESPLTVDATLPSVLIIVCTELHHSSTSHLHLQVSESAILLQKDVEEGLVVSAKVASLAVTFEASLSTTPAVHLGHADPRYNGPHTPLARFEDRGLSLKFVKQPQHTIIRIGSSAMDARLVTASLDSVLATAHVWSSAIDRIDLGPTQDAASSLISAMLSPDALRSDEYTELRPIFASVKSSPLHKEDERNIRLNHGWRILSQLRVVYSAMQATSKSLPSAAPLGDIKELCERLGGLDWFEESAYALTLNQPFVQQIVGDSAARRSASSMSIIFTSDILSLRHYDRLLGQQSLGVSSVVVTGVSAGVTSVTASEAGSPANEYRVFGAVKSIGIDIRDSILALVQSIMANKPARTPSTASPTDTGPPAGNGVALKMTCDIHLGSGGIDLTAGGVRITAIINHLHSIVVYAPTPSAHVSSIVVTYETSSLTMLALAQQAGKRDYPVLDMTTHALRSVFSLDAGHGDEDRKVRALVGLSSLTFETKAQLRSFLFYVHEWKDKYQAQYASAIAGMRSDTGSERTHCKPTAAVKCPWIITTDITLRQAQVKIRAAKSVWVIWQIGKSYMCGQGTAQRFKLGISLDPQEIKAVAEADLALIQRTFARSPRPADMHDARLRLPSIRVNGSIDFTGAQHSIVASVDLGALTGKIKPVVLDRLLSLYQRLGVDMRQIYDDYREEIASMLPKERKDKPAPTSTPMSFDIEVQVALVRIALQAEKVPAAVLFEALSLQGSASNRRTAHRALEWHARAQHMSLSLGALDSGPLSDSIEPTGRYRSAYTQADVKVREIPGDIRTPSQLSVSLSKVHTVMQIAALREISDLVSSWTSDIHVLKEKRATEVAEVKERTSKILKRIEASERGIQPELSWFASRLFTVDINGFAVAVPLDREMAIDLRPKKRSSVPAMLFSIRSINFQNRRNETARFRLQTMMLQFLHHFDQNMPTQFAGEYHQTDNLMSLPLIDAEAQMSSTAEEWTLAAHSCATDFKLTLAPSIANHVFQLVDMYHQGREHIVQLEKHYLAEHLAIDAASAGTTQPEIEVKPSQRIVCRMSFEFGSGIVQLIHHGTTGHVGGRRPSAKHDSIGLPRISVWLDYAGPHKGEDGVAVINTAIHGSQNELRPSILPFFADLASRIERRAAQKQKSRIPASKAAQLDKGTDEKSAANLANPSTSITRISASLRIDQSKLRLLDPDSQAFVDLEWESGGFIGNMTVGAEENATFAGTISGVTTELSNTNEPENSCIKATARDMAVTIVYAPQWREDLSGVSIVFDTKVAAQFNLDKFNSWLTFVAVWVDNAPGLDAPIAAAITDSASNPQVAKRLEKRKMGLAILARFQEVDFDAKIDVTHAKLSIKPIILHSTSNGYRTKVDLRIGVTEVSASGKVSGLLRSDHLTFQTLRKSSRAAHDVDPQLLRMSIDAGTLSGHLRLREHSVAKFELLPTIVHLHDDWQDSKSPPNLTFSVDAGNFTGVLRLQMIAELLERFYDVLDLVERQHFIANQRSEAFRSRTVQRNNEPSPIAVALMQSMQKVGKQMVDGEELDFAQVMHFRLAGINLGVFNNDDVQQVDELYHFVVGVMEVELTSVPKRTDGVQQQGRDLKVNVGAMRWDSQDNSHWSAEHDKAEMTPEEVLVKVLGRKTPILVAKVPSLALHIPSTEDVEDAVFRYSRDMVWGVNEVDGLFRPQFFAKATDAGYKLLDGINHAEKRRWRHLRKIRPSDASIEEPNLREIAARRLSATGNATERKLKYIDLEPDKPMPVPKIAWFGDSSQEILNRFGAQPMQTVVENLPRWSHRFITLPLEEGMELLLKLYAKQLPDQLA